METQRMVLWAIIVSICCSLATFRDVQEAYVLARKIAVPTQFVIQHSDSDYGGDLRIGDLQNRGQVDFLIYRGAQLEEGGASHPVFLGAFDLDGEVLWSLGAGGVQPNRPGAVAIHDIDADGHAEVIALISDGDTLSDPFSLKGTRLCILDGKTGLLEKSNAPQELISMTGRGPNWVHQRILIANLLGHKSPQEFIIKVGKKVFAFDQNLTLLWSYFHPNDTYQACPAYIPAVGDVDNDGRDEVNGGYYLIDDDGTVLWDRTLGRNMDCVVIDYWDSDTIKRALCSGAGFVLDHHGDTLLHLGQELIPHGQEMRVGDFLKDVPGRELFIRHLGHQPDVVLIGQGGRLLNQFQLNESPNHTGMMSVNWYGPDEMALLYNGGALFDGEGVMRLKFAELPDPRGPQRQGWYHAIPVDLYGNDGEDLVIYNPWTTDIFIFSGDTSSTPSLKSYQPNARQYNPRLMD